MEKYTIDELEYIAVDTAFRNDEIWYAAMVELEKRNAISPELAKKTSIL